MQKINAQIVLLVLILMTGVIGCAIFGGEGHSIEQSESYFFYSCGVADGGAYDIYIPEEPMTSCRDWETRPYGQTWSESYTRIYLTRFPYPFPDSEATFYFGIESDPDSGNGSGGWAGFCREGEEECVEALRGTIQLPFLPDNVFNTRVDILFEDGSTYNRALDMLVCQPDVTVLCG